MAAVTLKSDLSKKIEKYVNNRSLYIIIIIGIVFMVFSGGYQPPGDNVAQNHDAYTDEVRLGEILSRIDGVGKVHVMVTYYGTTTRDIAFEKKQNVSYSEDETVKSEETSVVTSGSEPLVKGIVYPKAKGVVIIAEGAGDVRVKKNITDAVIAALDIASFKVCVLEGKE